MTRSAGKQKQKMVKLKSLQHVLWPDLGLSLFNLSPDLQLHFANDKLYMHWFS